jgi:hypothetical protein
VGEAKPFNIPKRVVWKAFKRVKANQGAADLSNNLYKLWNRMCSGSYFPPPRIRRRRRSSTVRMRTGVAISPTNRSIFSVSHTEQGRRYGRGTSTRTVSCPQLDRKRSRPSAGRSGVGHFTITVTSPFKIWPKRTIRISKAGSTTTATSIGRSCARPSRGSMSMSSAGRFKRLCEWNSTHYWGWTDGTRWRLCHVVSN